MKALIRIALVLIIGIIAYNYFAGTSEEKETSQEIINTAKDLGAATWAMLKSEKEKFDNGKYDGFMEDVKGLFGSLREKAQQLGDKESLDKLEDLDRRREKIETEMKEQEEVDPKLKEEMKKLMEETEDLMRKMTEEME